MKLEQASISDIPLLLEIQKVAFLPLYHRYKDKKNPIFMDQAGIKKRMEMAGSSYYLLVQEEAVIGFIRVIEGDDQIRISPIAVLPDYQGCGIGKTAMLALEELYSSIHKFVLDTILEEKGLCSFYESLGYKQVGSLFQLQEGMTLVDYEKLVSRVE